VNAFVSSFLTLPFPGGNEQETKMETARKIPRVCMEEVETALERIFGKSQETKANRFQPTNERTNHV
jgi:hypothetical protein